MDTIFAVLASHGFVIFGGALIRRLRKEPFAESDIDVMTEGNTRQCAGHIAEILLLHLGISNVTIRPNFTRDYSFSLGNPYILKFEYENEQRRVDIVCLNNPKIDYDVNSLYYEDGEIKTLLPKGDVRKIIANIQAKVCRRTRLPEFDDREGDESMTRRRYYMVNKGFTFVKSDSEEISSEELSTLTADLVPEIDILNRIDILPKLHNVTVFGLDAVLLFKHKRLRRHAVVCGDIAEQTGFTCIGDTLHYEHGTIRFLPERPSATANLDNLIWQNNAFVNSDDYIPDIMARKFKKLDSEAWDFPYFSIGFRY